MIAWGAGLIVLILAFVFYWLKKTGNRLHTLTCRRK